MSTTNRPRHTSRRIGRLGLRAAATSLVMALSIGAAAGSASADLGVGPKAKITQTGLAVHGTWANLRWTANVSSWTLIRISTAPPALENGVWTSPPDSTYGVVHKENGEYSYNALALKPATKYHVVITTPAEGDLALTQAVGQFTTKKIVSIKATFDKVHVSDDGDGLGKGAGDLWWYFSTSFASWTPGWHRSTSSGDSFTVPAERGVLSALNPYVGSAVTVTLQAAEDDIAWNDGSCNVGHTGFDTWKGGGALIDSYDCAEYSFAQTTVNLPGYVWESQPAAFSASTPSSRSPLGFTVNGKIQVTYA